MTPMIGLSLCISAFLIIFFFLGYRLRDLVVAEVYENHLNRHGAGDVVPGCIFCGVERPEQAREIRELMQ